MSSTNGDTVENLPDTEPMEVDSEDHMPGGFEEPDLEAGYTNGDSSPVPPPHQTPPPSLPKPSHDPEECKALGNKYFKAKDYTKAIAEYTKGIFP